jgi:hypothetical protein
MELGSCNGIACGCIAVWLGVLFDYVTGTYLGIYADPERAPQMCGKSIIG